MGIQYCPHLRRFGQQIEVEAAVSSTLPMGVLLGMDTQELVELLVGVAEENALVVATRATERKQKLAAKECSQRERACGVRPRMLEVSDHKF